MQFVIWPNSYGVLAYRRSVKDVFHIPALSQEEYLQHL